MEQSLGHLYRTKADLKHTHTTEEITGTVANATHALNADNAENAVNASNIPFSGITGLPTTLVDYGITDAAKSVHTHQKSEITDFTHTHTGDEITSIVPMAIYTNTAGVCTGNAATATKLENPRTINGVAFDGSADITIAGSSTFETDIIVNGLKVGQGTIGGGMDNTVFGNSAFCYNQTGYQNVAIGSYALQNNTTGGDNIAIGIFSLNNNTTGINNTASGCFSLQKNKTGNQNTAIGSFSLSSNVTSDGNTAIGYQSLMNNVGGKLILPQAIIAGQEYTIQIVGTTDFTLIGAPSNTVGITFTATGIGRLGTTGRVSPKVTANTAIGNQSLQNNTTGNNNTATGYQTLYNNTTGYNNTAIGYQALYNNTASINNTATGYQALYNNTTGGGNTAFGSYALNKNTTGSGNIASGSNALYANTTGSNNIATGNSVLQSNTAGNYNIATGYCSLYSNITGNFNTAIGYNALYNNGPSVSAGYFIVGISYTIKTLGDTDFTLIGASNNTVGTVFTATGAGAGTGIASSNTDYNTAIGYNSLQNNTNGVNNTAIGSYSLQNNTNGGFNVALGTSTLKNANGNYNIGIGTDILNNLAACNGKSNIGIGKSVLGYLKTGNYNIALGESCCDALYNGSDNVAIGRGSFNGVEGSNNIGIGMNAGNSTGMGATFDSCTMLGYNTAYQLRMNLTNTTCLGANSIVSGSNQVQLGDSNTTTYAYGVLQNRSDMRDKADITDTALGLDFINKLRPVDFRWDYREDYIEYVEKEVPVLNEDGTQKLDEQNNPITTKTVETIEHERDGSKKRNRKHHGLIAQEVKVVIDNQGIDFGGFQDHSLNGGKDVLSIGYEELIAPMIKAIQEQQKMIDELKAEVAALKTK